MFECDVQSEESAKRIVIRGRIDALSAPDVQKLFDRLILAGERVLLVDMSAVSYVSSAGLRPFLASQKQLKKVGGEIVLLEMTEQVFEIFGMSGLTTIFRIAGKGELKDLLQGGRSGDAIVAAEIDGFRLEYMDGVAKKGRLFTIGSPSTTFSKSSRF
jgi:anti-anti-sigma factor